MRTAFAVLLLAAIALFLAAPATGVLAQSSGPGNTGNPTAGPGNTGITLTNPLTGCQNKSNQDCLMSLLNGILGFVIEIGTVVIILMIVYVGFKFVTAQGEPGAITEAKQALLWTIIGALILLGAQAISVGLTETVRALTG